MATSTTRAVSSKAPSSKTSSANTPLFNQIRWRLLLSNLAVFSLVLGGFAIAVRTTFLYNLRQQYRSQAEALARSAIAVVELEAGQLEVESDEMSDRSVNATAQGIEWFDAQGQPVDQLGEVHPSEALVAMPSAIPNVTPDLADLASSEIQIGQQYYASPMPIQSFVLAIDNSRQGTIAYVRASQSLEPFYATRRQFDWGLGTGLFVALGLSGLGGFWLNRQAMRPIEDSFKRLQQFTADASHELRNPIMAITSNAEVALKYSEGMRPDDRETLELIVNAADQMSDLTGDLLLLARFDRQAKLEKVPIDLTRLLENLVRLYQSQASDKSIQFSAEIQPGLQIMGDSHTLTRAFTNLIQNALRYTLSQGEVSVKGWRKADQLFISVEDTGVGIAAENMDKIFDRFWRADKARTRAAGGSGLGLSITQAIVQNHEGSLSVQSQVDQGSCFTVQLPAYALKMPN